MCVEHIADSLSLCKRILTSEETCINLLSSVIVFLLQAIRAINGTEQEVSAEEFTDMVFDKIDLNGDGIYLSIYNKLKKKYDQR